MRTLSLPSLAWVWWVGVLVLGLLCPGMAAESKAAGGTGRATPATKRQRTKGTAVSRLPAPPRGLAHTVRPGETLWQVARQHGVSVEALVRANRLAPTARLRIGQRLSIPASAATESQEPPSLAEIALDAPPVPLVPLQWPVAGRVGSSFGPRGAAWHGGVDLQAERGAEIRAAAGGMVVQSSWERGYGRVVKIWHPGDLMTVYAHNQENLVRVGDWVEQGQVIGTVGATGRATAPHLHFEVRLDGRKYDPLFWLPEPGTVEIATAEPRPAVSAP